MAIFFHILSHNIVPIFFLIGIGFLLSRKFHLDIFSLSKLMFYVFVPAFIFVNLYCTPLKLDMLKVVLCTVMILAANAVLGQVIAVMRHYDIGMRNAFKNSIMFNNTGNIGVSLITLVFSSVPFVLDGQTPYLNEALTAQIMVLVVQNISMNTLGFYNAGKANGSALDSVKKVLLMPAIYVVLLALALNYLHIDIKDTPVWTTLCYLKDGMVAIALITLGVQLARTKFDFGSFDAQLSVFIKLVAGPLLSIVFIHIFGLSGIAAQVVFIAHAVPTAVNTALIAVECRSCPDFASQAVMMSTLLSAVTLTLAIYAAQFIFPV